MFRVTTIESRRILAGAALAVFLLGLGIAVARGLDDGDSTTVAAPTADIPATRTPPAPPPAPKPAHFVKLTGAGAFDPEGDGRERDEEAPMAVDGRDDTFWRTERYSRFFKQGVGLVLDAGRRVRVEQVVVESPTPGIRAQIRLGDAREGPFTVATPAATLAAKTPFSVARKLARYVVVWVVGLPPGSAGEISEVRVRAR